MWNHNRLNGRRNIFEVFEAWQDNRPRTKGAISTDGDTVYSYGTAIAARSHDGRIVVNRSRHSKTTTNHQNGIATGIRTARGGPDVDVSGHRDIDGVRGLDGDDLLRVAFPS